MPHYKAPDNALHFLSAEDVANGGMAMLPDGAVEIPAERAAEILRIASAPTAAQLWSAHQAQAQSALDASDITMIRCVEHGVAVPAEWATYRGALRAIVRSASGDPTQPLPTRPAYPVGT